MKVIFGTVTVCNCKRNRPNTSHLLYEYCSWCLMVITNVTLNAMICIQSSKAKLWGYVRSGAECGGHRNDFELIPTIKMETRHPI